MARFSSYIRKNDNKRSEYQVREGRGAPSLVFLGGKSSSSCQQRTVRQSRGIYLIDELVLLFSLFVFLTDVSHAVQKLGRGGAIRGSGRWRKEGVFSKGVCTGNSMRVYINRRNTIAVATRLRASSSAVLFIPWHFGTHGHTFADTSSFNNTGYVPHYHAVIQGAHPIGGFPMHVGGKEAYQVYMETGMGCLRVLGIRSIHDKVSTIHSPTWQTAFPGQTEGLPDQSRLDGRDGAVSTNFPTQDSSMQASISTFLLKQLLTSVLRTLLLPLPCLLCLSYQMFPLVNRMVLLVCIMCLLKCPAMGDAVEYTRQERGISDDLIEERYS